MPFQTIYDLNVYHFFQNAQEFIQRYSHRQQIFIIVTVKLFWFKIACKRKAKAGFFKRMLPLLPISCKKLDYFCWRRNLLSSLEWELTYKTFPYFEKTTYRLYDHSMTGFPLKSSRKCNFVLFLMKSIFVMRSINFSGWVSFASIHWAWKSMQFFIHAQCNQ